MRDLGFSAADRAENIRRAGELARLFFEQGCLVICAFVSPYRQHRNSIRALLPSGRFVEVFVKADFETCLARDPKGLYARARSGDIADFTGVSAPYEAPLAAEVVIDTVATDAEAATGALLAYLQEHGLLR